MTSILESLSDNNNSNPLIATFSHNDDDDDKNEIVNNRNHTNSGGQEIATTTSVPPIFGLLEKHWWDGNAFAVVQAPINFNAGVSTTTMAAVPVIVPLLSKSTWEKNQEELLLFSKNGSCAKDESFLVAGRSTHNRHQFQTPSLCCPAFPIGKMDFLPRSALRIQNIAILDLSNSSLSDLGSGATWRFIARTLRVLYLHDNRITRYAYIESVLSELYNLQHLTLAGNFIEPPRVAMKDYRNNNNNNASGGGGFASLRQVIAQSFLHLLVLDEHFILDVERLDFVYVESDLHKRRKQHATILNLQQKNPNTNQYLSEILNTYASRSLYVPFSPHTHIGFERTSYQLRKQQIDDRQQKLALIMERRKNNGDGRTTSRRNSLLLFQNNNNPSPLPTLAPSITPSQFEKKNENEIMMDEERFLSCNGRAITATTTFESLLSWEWKHLRYLPIRAAALSPAAHIQKSWRRHHCMKKYQELKEIKKKKDLIQRIKNLSAVGSSSEFSPSDQNHESVTDEKVVAERKKMQSALEVLQRVLSTYCRVRRGLKKMVMRKVNASAEASAKFYQQPSTSEACGMINDNSNQNKNKNSSKHFVLFVDQLQMFRWEKWVGKMNEKNNDNDNVTAKKHAKFVMGTEGAETLKRKYIEYEKFILQDQQQEQQQQISSIRSLPLSNGNVNHNAPTLSPPMLPAILAQNAALAVSAESSAVATRTPGNQNFNLGGSAIMNFNFMNIAKNNVVLSSSGVGPSGKNNLNASLMGSLNQVFGGASSSQNNNCLSPSAASFDDFTRARKRKSIVKLFTSTHLTDEMIQHHDEEDDADDNNNEEQNKPPEMSLDVGFKTDQTAAFLQKSNSNPFLSNCRSGEANSPTMSLSSNTPNQHSVQPPKKLLARRQTAITGQIEEAARKSHEKDDDDNGTEKNNTDDHENMMSQTLAMANNNTTSGNDNDAGYDNDSETPLLTSVQNTSLYPVLMMKQNQLERDPTNVYSVQADHNSNSINNSGSQAQIIAKKFNKARRRQIMSLVEPWYASWPSWHNPANDKRDVNSWDLLRSVVTASYNPRKFLYRPSQLSSIFENSGGISDDIFTSDVISSAAGQNNNSFVNCNTSFEEAMFGPAFRLDEGNTSSEAITKQSSKKTDEFSQNVLSSLVSQSLEKKQQRVVGQRRYLNSISSFITHLPTTKKEELEMDRKKSSAVSFLHNNNKKENESIKKTQRSNSIFSGMVISEGRRQSLAAMMSPTVRVGAPAASTLSTYQTYDSASPLLRSFKTSFASKERQEEFDRTRPKQFVSKLFKVKQRAFTPIPLQAVEFDSAQSMTKFLMQIHFCNRAKPRNQIHFFFEEDLVMLRAVSVLQAWWRGTWTRLRFQSWQVFSLVEERREEVEYFANKFDNNNNNNRDKNDDEKNKENNTDENSKKEDFYSNMLSNKRYVTAFPLTRNMWNYKIAKTLRVGPSIVLFSCIQVQNWWRVVLAKRRFKYLKTLHSLVENHVNRQSSRLYLSSKTLLALLKDIQQIFGGTNNNFTSASAVVSVLSVPQNQQSNIPVFSLGQQTPGLLFASPQTNNLQPPHQGFGNPNYFSSFDSVIDPSCLIPRGIHHHPNHLHHHQYQTTKSSGNNSPQSSATPVAVPYNIHVSNSNPPISIEPASPFVHQIHLTAANITQQQLSADQFYQLQQHQKSQHHHGYHHHHHHDRQQSSTSFSDHTNSVYNAQKQPSSNSATEQLQKELFELQQKINEHEFISSVMRVMASHLDQENNNNNNNFLVSLCNKLIPELASVHRDALSSLAESLRSSASKSEDAIGDAKQEQTLLVQKATAIAVGDHHAAAAATAATAASKKSSDVLKKKRHHHHHHNNHDKSQNGLSDQSMSIMMNPGLLSVTQANQSMMLGSQSFVSQRGHKKSFSSGVGGAAEESSTSVSLSFHPNLHQKENNNNSSSLHESGFQRVSQQLNEIRRANSTQEDDAAPNNSFFPFNQSKGDDDDVDVDDQNQNRENHHQKQRSFDIRLPMAIRCRYTSPELYFDSLMDDQSLSALGCMSRENLVRFSAKVEAELSLASYREQNNTTGNGLMQQHVMTASSSPKQENIYSHYYHHAHGGRRRSSIASLNQPSNVVIPPPALVSRDISYSSSRVMLNNNNNNCNYNQLEKQKPQPQQKNPRCAPPTWLLKFAAAAILLHGSEITQFFTGELDCFGFVVKKVSPEPKQQEQDSLPPGQQQQPLEESFNGCTSGVFSGDASFNAGFPSNQSIAQSDPNHNEMMNTNNNNNNNFLSASPKVQSSKSANNNNRRATIIGGNSSSRSPGGASTRNAGAGTSIKLSHDEAKKKYRQDALCRKVVDIWSSAYKHSTKKKKSLEEQQQERNKKMFQHREDPTEKSLLAVLPSEGNFLERVNWLIRVCEEHPNGFVSISSVTSNEALSRFLLVASLTWQLPFGELLCPEPLERLMMKTAVLHIEKWWIHSAAQRKIAIAKMRKRKEELANAHLVRHQREIEEEKIKMFGTKVSNLSSSIMKKSTTSNNYAVETNNNNQMTNNSKKNVTLPTELEIARMKSFNISVNNDNDGIESSMMMSATTNDFMANSMTYNNSATSISTTNNNNINSKMKGSSIFVSAAAAATKEPSRKEQQKQHRRPSSAKQNNNNNNNVSTSRTSTSIPILRPESSLSQFPHHQVGTSAINPNRKELSSHEDHNNNKLSDENSNKPSTPRQSAIAVGNVIASGFSSTSNKTISIIPNDSIQREDSTTRAEKAKLLSVGQTPSVSALIAATAAAERKKTTNNIAAAAVTSATNNNNNNNTSPSVAVPGKLRIRRKTNSFICMGSLQQRDIHAPFVATNVAAQTMQKRPTAVLTERINEFNQQEGLEAERRSGEECHEEHDETQKLAVAPQESISIFIEPVAETKTSLSREPSHLSAIEAKRGHSDIFSDDNNNVALTSSYNEKLSSDCDSKQNQQQQSATTEIRSIIKLVPARPPSEFNNKKPSFSYQKKPSLLLMTSSEISQRSFTAIVKKPDWTSKTAPHRPLSASIRARKEAGVQEQEVEEEQKQQQQEEEKTETKKVEKSTDEENFFNDDDDDDDVEDTNSTYSLGPKDEIIVEGDDEKTKRQKAHKNKSPTMSKAEQLPEMIPDDLFAVENQNEQNVGLVFIEPTENFLETTRQDNKNGSHSTTSRAAAGGGSRLQSSHLSSPRNQNDDSSSSRPGSSAAAAAIASSRPHSRLVELGLHSMNSSLRAAYSQSVNADFVTEKSFKSQQIMFTTDPLLSTTSGRNTSMSNFVDDDEKTKAKRRSPSPKKATKTSSPSKKKIPIARMTPRPPSAIAITMKQNNNNNHHQTSSILRPIDVEFEGSADENLNKQKADEFEVAISRPTSARQAGKPILHAVGENHHLFFMQKKKSSSPSSQNQRPQSARLFSSTSATNLMIQNSVPQKLSEKNTNQQHQEFIPIDSHSFHVACNKELTDAKKRSDTKRKDELNSKLEFLQMQNEHDAAEKRDKYLQARASSATRKERVPYPVGPPLVPFSKLIPNQRTTTVEKKK